MGAPPPTETTGLVPGGADKAVQPGRSLICSQLIVAVIALALLGSVGLVLVLIYHVRPADQVRPAAYAFALSIAHLNDHHSHIEETRLAVPITDNAGVTAAVGGWPRLVTLLRELSAERPNLLKLHAGDAITGTLWYTIFKGGADAAVMRMACLDAYELGNHEFDNGKPLPLSLTLTLALTLALALALALALTLRRRRRARSLHRRAELRRLVAVPGAPHDATRLFLDARRG